MTTSHPSPKDPTRRQVYRLLQPARDLHGEVALWMAVLDEARRVTLEAVQGLGPDELAWNPPRGGNAIGQLLRHVAAVELEWIFGDLCGGVPYPKDRPAMLKDENPMAHPGTVPLSAYLETLEWVRGLTRSKLAELKPEEIESSRTFKGAGVQKVFNVRWILWHIADHEAQHRGQMLAVKRMLSSK